MSIRIDVYAVDAEKERVWVNELRALLSSIEDIQIFLGNQQEPHGQIILIDGEDPNHEGLLHSLQWSRKGRAIFLVVDESQTIVPNVFGDHQVDDLIVHPFRLLEVVSKVKLYEQLILWQELIHVNSSLTEVLDYFREDLSLTERLHQAQVPKRFPEVNGFKVANRYLAGLRSGGDYFDLAESNNKNHLSLMMTHSSSYGLCSSVVSILMRAALKLSINQLDESGVTALVVRQISDEISLTLGERDSLTLFFGNILRKERVFRYTHCGDVLFFYAPQGKDFEIKQAQSARIHLEQSLAEVTEDSFPIAEGGRIVLLSAGFLESVQGGQDGLLQVLNSLRDVEIEKVLNEFIYRVKSQWGDVEMPARDCSALIFEILPGFDKKIVQIAKPKQVGS